MSNDTMELERTRTGSPGEGGEPEQGGGILSGGVNVGSLERWASLLGGGLLIARGLSRGGAAGIASALIGGALAQRGATGHCQLYGALGMSTAEPGDQRWAAGLMGGTRPVEVEVALAVLRPAEELYRFWRDPANLPRFMSSVESVVPESDRRARWTVSPPRGPGIEFVAEITEEREGERIAWRSEESAVVEHTGEVSFGALPGDRGTAVRVRLLFTPPAGPLGAGVARLFDGAMEMQLRNDLRRFKQLMETGEIATTDGQPSGRRDD